MKRGESILETRRGSWLAPNASRYERASVICYLTRPGPSSINDNKPDVSIRRY